MSTFDPMVAHHLMNASNSSSIILSTNLLQNSHVLSTGIGSNASGLVGTGLLGSNVNANCINGPLNNLTSNDSGWYICCLLYNKERHMSRRSASSLSDYDYKLYNNNNLYKTKYWSIGGLLISY
jgi:hypothetical protein